MIAQSLGSNCCSERALPGVGAASLNPKTSKTKLLSITLTLLAASILGAQQAEAQVLEWAASYNGIPTGALEETDGVVVDASGNVFATGLSGNGTGSAICTMKMNPSGAIQWKVVESKASLCGGMWSGRTPIVQ